TVTGAVRDARGEPVAGARVVAGRAARPYDRRGPDGSAVQGPAPRETATGADGTFTIASLEPGDVPVVVRARGFAAWSTRVRPAAGEVVRLDVVLQPAATVAGTCRDSGGAPQ